MADIIITVLTALIIIFIWIILYDTNRFVIRNLKVEDERIKRNCKAIVLADLHNKRFGKNNEKLIASIKSQNPDFILVAGDMLIAMPGKNMSPAIEFMNSISEICPIYYGNGNHEHRIKLYPEKYKDMSEIYEKAMAEAKIEMLINRKKSLPEYGITIFGSEIGEEFYLKKFKKPMPEDYMETLLGKPAEDDLTILLAHNPEYFERYAEWGADLTLSGHVHGGVMRVPFWGKGVISPSFRLFPKYDGGVFEKGKAKMLLSRGLGIHTIPVRIFNPGEYWVVEFQNKNTGK